MNAVPGADAIAVYGSTARGDKDELSDLDLLLIGPNRQRLQDSSVQLGSKGWCPTIYTWLELESAVKRESLFVQHLRRDSVIIRDKDDHLRHLLAISQQRSSYAWERQQALNLFSAIEHIPHVPWGGAWALDVTFVAFRSFAVAFLADEDLVTFSIGEIISHMCRCGLLRHEDSYGLAQLRAWKKWYRDGATWSPPLSQVQELIDTIDRRLRIGIHIQRTDQETFSAWAVAQAGTGDHWYRSARLWEAFLQINGTTEDNRVLEMLRLPQIYGRSLVRHLDYIAAAA
jgi:hypothetical protein